MHKVKIIRTKILKFWKIYFDEKFIQTANANSDSKSEPNSSLNEIVKFLFNKFKISILWENCFWAENCGYIDVGDGCWRQNVLMATKQSS